MTNRKKIQELQKAIGTNPDGKMQLDPPGETLRAILAVAKSDPDAEWGAKPKPVDGPTDSEKVDDRSEGNIATLHPKVQPYARALIHQAITQGINLKITSGTRTYAEQDALYAQGGVTKARGGYSNHNFGLAFDVTLFKEDGHTPIYESPAYRDVMKIGRGLGLSCGGDWKSFPDEPHYELHPAWASGMSENDMLAELRQRHAAGIDQFA